MQSPYRNASNAIQIGRESFAEKLVLVAVCVVLLVGVFKVLGAHNVL
jgi:hypothetical protein